MEYNSRKLTKSANFRAFGGDFRVSRGKIPKKCNQISRSASDRVLIPVAFSTSSAVRTSLTRKTT